MESKKRSTSQGKSGKARLSRKEVRQKLGKNGKQEKFTASGWLLYKELDPSCSKVSYAALSKALSPTENRCYTVKLGTESAVTTDGSGLLATVFSNIASGAQNWSNYADVFDEHRVLAMEIHFRPMRAIGGSTQTFQAPIIHVTDRSDATPLTGYGLATRYESCKESAGGTGFLQTWSMASVEEAQFLSTASPAANAWIKLYSAGNSASFTIGRMYTVLVVQFRGLGIN